MRCFETIAPWQLDQTPNIVKLLPMNKNQFDEHLGAVFKRTTKVLQSKRNEYANDTDVFQSFKQGIGISYQKTPEGVGWEYMSKHLESIKQIIRELDKETPSLEKVNEKFGDAINYLIIIEGMLKDRIAETK